MAGRVCSRCSRIKSETSSRSIIPSFIDIQLRYGNIRRTISNISPFADSSCFSKHSLDEPISCYVQPPVFVYPCTKSSERILYVRPLPFVFICTCAQFNKIFFRPPNGKKRVEMQPFALSIVDNRLLSFAIPILIIVALCYIMYLCPVCILPIGTGNDRTNAFPVGHCLMLLAQFNDLFTAEYALRRCVLLHVN